MPQSPEPVAELPVDLEKAWPNLCEPDRPPSNLWRKHVNVLGILWPAVKQRWAEFADRGFAPFATELVCFDLRRRRDHDVTHPIATDPRDVQDAIDWQTRRRHAAGRLTKHAKHTGSR
jgi:hypothetical protein